MLEYEIKNSPKKYKDFKTRAIFSITEKEIFTRLTDLWFKMDAHKKFRN